MDEWVRGGGGKQSSGRPTSTFPVRCWRICGSMSSMSALYVGDTSTHTRGSGGAASRWLVCRAPLPSATLATFVAGSMILGCWRWTQAVDTARSERDCCDSLIVLRGWRPPSTTTTGACTVSSSARRDKTTGRKIGSDKLSWSILYLVVHDDCTAPLL